MLWIRDDAHLLRKPSIDRKDNNGNYEYGNCRFIEFAENTNIGRELQYKKVRKYDMKGNLMKEYSSLTKALADLDKDGFSISNISKCANGEYKQAYGYRWKFVSSKTTT